MTRLLRFLDPLLRMILVLVLGVSLTACGGASAPISLAPPTSIVRNAIALQLSKTQDAISQQLNLQAPKLNISHLSITQIEPLLIQKLPTYHIGGTYDLTLKLPDRQEKQPKHPFDLYLQRQIEGKSWRLLIPKQEGEKSQPTWYSYILNY